MALKKEITTLNGFDAPDAYHRIGDIKVQNKLFLSFDVKTFKDSNMSFGAIECKKYSCAYDLDGGNVLSQGYAYLKTLGTFAGATDV